jgi:hypothetical protein
MAAVCGVMRANAQSHQPSVLPSVDPLQAFVGQFLPPSGASSCLSHPVSVLLDTPVDALFPFVCPLHTNPAKTGPFAAQPHEIASRLRLVT